MELSTLLNKTITSINVIDCDDSDCATIVIGVSKDGVKESYILDINCLKNNVNVIPIPSTLAKYFHN